MKAGKGWNMQRSHCTRSGQWLLCLFLERDYQRIITFLTEFPAFTTYILGAREIRRSAVTVER